MTEAGTSEGKPSPDGPITAMLAGMRRKAQGQKSREGDEGLAKMPKMSDLRGCPGVRGRKPPGPQRRAQPVVAAEGWGAPWNPPLGPAAANYSNRDTPRIEWVAGALEFEAFPEGKSGPGPAVSPAVTSGPGKG
ncbi:collagen alpha-1(XVI) chain-like [Penaeus monodon]|uniref:collagen alpha-1(XVI) chain-like n=1 Tax=Penaeus monodon TaxID=6687 RepID=UPI0018A73674|nr:collagen alpha-1(XVI) chain-like [Penaeus monodon]